MSLKLFVTTIIYLQILISISFSQTSKQEKINDSNLSFISCNQEASFPGGIDSLYFFLKRNINWKIPAGCNYGKVYVAFTIDTLGTIKDAKIARGICAPLDNEVLRVISIMPKWEPSFEIVDNKKRPISVVRNLPIDFHK